MEEEGLRLRLLGHRLRRQGRYAEAGRAFLEAVELGDGEAHFEVAFALTFSGGLGLREDMEWGRRIQLAGCVLGNPLCEVLEEEFNAPLLTLEERLLCYYCDPGDEEVAAMIETTPDNRARLEQACHVAGDNPWPFFFLALLEERAGNKAECGVWMSAAASRGLAPAQVYDSQFYLYNLSDMNPEFIRQATRQYNLNGAENLVNHPEVGTLFSAKDIATAVSLLEYVKDNAPADLLHSVMMENTLNLSREVLSEVRFWIGEYIYENVGDNDDRPEARYCLGYYHEAQRRAAVACVAWLGCWKRRRFQALSKDTVVLVAQAMKAIPLINWCAPMVPVAQAVRELKLRFRFDKLLANEK